MKIKRTLAALVALSLVASLCMGCNKKEESGEVPLLTSGETYTPEKDLDVTVWVTQGSDYVSPDVAKDNVVRKWLEDKTRVKVVNTYGNGGGQWEGILARLIAGDNFPELIGCGGGQGPTHFAKLAQANKIWELTPEMLQTYAPNIWEKVPQEMWERIKVNGKIYGVPYYFPVDREIDSNITDAELEAWGAGEPSNVGTSLWIRDDILKMIYPEAHSYEELMKLMDEKGNIAEEFYDVELDSTEKIVDLMRKIKDLDLKVGDKKVYAFGYAGADCWVPFARLGPELSGYVGHNYITAWDTEKKEIHIPLLEDTIKDTALLQNQLLREKVIDPESLMHTDAQFKEKVLNGQYAIAVLNAVEHPPFINSALEANGKNFHYRPLYTKVPSQKGYGVVKQQVSWGQSVGILKAVAAEDVPQILNWMDTQFTDEWDEIRYWGPESAGLYTVENGVRRFKNEELNKKYIDNVESSIPAEDCYGLNDGCGPFYLQFKTQSIQGFMTPDKHITYQLIPESAGKIMPDSKLASEYDVAPPFNAWDAEYASLDTVIKFWSSRSQWEDPFKVTLSAQSDEEFEAKWNSAVENLKTIIDVDKMTKEMTDIARDIIK